MIRVNIVFFFFKSGRYGGSEGPATQVEEEGHVIISSLS